MRTRGNRRAPGRHIAPKSRSRFLTPIAIGAAVVMGGSAATGATNVLQTPNSQSKSVVDSGSSVKSSEQSKVATKTESSNVKKTASTTTKKNIRSVALKSGIRTESKITFVRFGSTTVHDADLVKGTRLLRSNGIPGKIQVVYRVKYLKGEPIARVVVAKKLISKPKDAVYIVGTGKPTAVEASLQNAAGKTGNPSGNKVFAQAYIAKTHGWNGQEFACLTSLWNRESHWRHTARNRGSGAYGIPQAMPGSKMAKFGADWRTNPVTQIKWGVNYIAKRYKTPCGALAHSHRTGWY